MNRRTAITTGLAAVAVAANITSPAQAAAGDENPELDKVRELLKAHDTAMTNHDLNGVMATLAAKASIMGTGPGEIWTGPEEIKVAYGHFFQSYDKGQQDFEYQFKIGSLSADMGWLLASGNVKGKKDGKEFAFPMNLSLTVAKADGQWKIAAMHFSTLNATEQPTK